MVGRSVVSANVLYIHVRRSPKRDKGRREAPRTVGERWIDGLWLEIRRIIRDYVPFVKASAIRRVQFPP
jgi:hypothetical protein